VEPVKELPCGRRPSAVKPVLKRQPSVKKVKPVEEVEEVKQEPIQEDEEVEEPIEEFN
jgi:hypothetical protein